MDLRDRHLILRSGLLLGVPGGGVQAVRFLGPENAEDLKDTVGFSFHCDAWLATS